MTDRNDTLPPALRRALELFTDPPTKPEISKGYLDLLDAGGMRNSFRCAIRRSTRWSRSQCYS